MKRECFYLVFALIIVLIFTGIAVSAPKRPTTVAELALYEGTDRQQILEEGARKEGTFTFYTSGILTMAVRPVVEAFEKKYPYIKVEIWRGDSTQLVPRTFEEYRAGRHIVDAVEVSQSGEIILEEGGILQPFYSPNLKYIEEGSFKKAPTGGAFAGGVFQSGLVVGFNTKLITKEQLPKTYQDLLDPKWKGKVPIVTSITGINWVGGLLESYGEKFVENIAKQGFPTHAVSPRALLDMIISGEYAFSPTILDSHVRDSKKKGAPVELIPLEPVTTYINTISLAKHAPHPHATMLFIDFELSKQSGEIYAATGYVSPRIDVGGERNWKKYYGPYSSKQVGQWNSAFQRLFVKK